MGYPDVELETDGGEQGEWTQGRGSWLSVEVEEGSSGPWESFPN